MRQRSIPQAELLCQVCGDRFQSGVVHIQRGWLESRLCLKCSDQELSLDRLRQLTAIRKRERIARGMDIENA
jgi:hypothetical protein